MMQLPSRISYAVNQAANFQVAVCRWGIALLGAAMTLIILLQVFFRFVVYVPFPASEELARYLMIWMAMFGSVIALRHGRHIGVRVLVERLPAGAYDNFAVPLVQACMVVFLCILAWQGWDLSMRNAMQHSPSLEISMRWPYLAVPVGALMMILDLVADMLQDRFPTSAGSSANIAAATLATDVKETCTQTDTSAQESNGKPIGKESTKKEREP